MDINNRSVMRETLLQEGVSCALAALHAISAAELFRDLPPGKAADNHNHGLWLLAMAEDHLRKIQQQVDDIDAPSVAAALEGC